MYIYNMYICGINIYFTDANPRNDLGTPAGWMEKFEVYIISMPAPSPNV